MKKSKQLKKISPSKNTAEPVVKKDDYEVPLLRRSVDCKSLYAQSTGQVYAKGGKLVEKKKSGGVLTPEEHEELGKHISSINIFETHRFLIYIPGTGRDIDQTSIVEFCEDLIREYSCNTTLEKSLCEVISASFYAYMRGVSYLQHTYDAQTLSHERNGHYTLVSKEIEKQSRLYMHALGTLKALKAPQENISIRAKNAFIAQNQQFNNNGTPSGENI